MKTKKTREIENNLFKNKKSNELWLKEFSIKGDKYNIIYDVITFDKKTNVVIGNEVKVTNADFNNLYRKLLFLDHNYFMYVDKFYIVVPEEMLKFSISKLLEWKKDILYINNVGLKYMDKTTKQIRTKINAKSNNSILYNTYIKDNVTVNIQNVWIKRRLKERKDNYRE